MCFFMSNPIETKKRFELEFVKKKKPVNHYIIQGMLMVGAILAYLDAFN